MANLTPSEILNDVTSSIQDTSTALRSKMLTWLNIVSIKLLNKRMWYSLRKTTVAAMVSSEIPLPIDFGEIVSLQTSSFYYTFKDKLTEEDVYIANNSGPLSRGFVVGESSIKVYPSQVDSNVTISYVPTTATLADNATATIFPRNFKPLFHRMCLDYYYEYDMDERAAASYSLDVPEYRELITWDNRLVPISKRTKYIRDRVY